MSEPRFTRDERGRAVTKRCPDPRCDGVQTYQADGSWLCDGLTHAREIGDPEASTADLEACTHAHLDGEPVAR